MKYYSCLIKFKMVDDEVILRKLGGAEIVYDYELKQQGCILPVSLLFTTKINLFESKHLIEDAIRNWKKYHPFLCSKIMIKDENDNIITRQDENYMNTFSLDRYFVLADQSKINGFDNIKYYRLDSVNQNLWMLLHERELNLEPIDCDNGLLWRLMFIELGKTNENLNNYCMIFTVHHAIVDARNCFAVLNHLLTIFEKMYLGKFDEASIKKFDLNPSIEEKLFNNDMTKLNDLKLNDKYDISPDNKISSSFKNSVDKNVNFFDDYEQNDKFIELFNDINAESLFVHDLITNRNENKLISKFVSFKLNENTLNTLLKGCKANNIKLTGCLNMICALATYDLYKNFEKNEENERLSEKICYHLLANLRPFLNIGNLNVGYWAIVLNGILNTNDEEFDLSNDLFYKEKFWQLAKEESDTIHSRIKEGELIENAKLDMVLLKMIQEDFKFENGGVHFAISNLGPLKQVDLDNITLTENYFNTSCK